MVVLLRDESIVSGMSNNSQKNAILWCHDNDMDAEIVSFAFPRE